MMSRAKGKMHHVTVIAEKDDAGGTCFAAGSDLWNGGALRFHKDHHGMKTQDFHVVEFVLDDRTEDGLRFPHIPHDAMWVSAVDDPANPTCPDKDTESNYDVLEPICVSDDGKRLIVRNDNPRREQWAFTLNLVKEGEDDSDVERYVSWDPIGDNHNGGA
jgi:hypothetical protein